MRKREVGEQVVGGGVQGVTGTKKVQVARGQVPSWGGQAQRGRRWRNRHQGAKWGGRRQESSHLPPQPDSTPLLASLLLLFSPMQQW